MAVLIDDVAKIYQKVLIEHKGEIKPLVYLLQFAGTWKTGYILCSDLENCLKAENESLYKALFELPEAVVKEVDGISLPVICGVTDKNPFFTNNFFNYSRSHAVVTFDAFKLALMRKNEKARGNVDIDYAEAKRRIERGSYIRVYDPILNVYAYVCVDNFIIKDSGVTIPAYFLTEADVKDKNLNIKVVGDRVVELEKFNLEYDSNKSSYKIIRNYKSFIYNNLNINTIAYQDDEKIVSYGKSHLSPLIINDNSKSFKVEVDNKAVDSVSVSITNHFDNLTRTHKDNKYFRIKGKPYCDYRLEKHL